MPAPTCALYYAPEGFETSREKLMGRHAAGEGFLRGMVRHAGFEPLVALTRSQADADAFRRQVAAMGATIRAEAILEDDLPKLSRIGALMIPGPGLGPPAWRRRRAGEAKAWSIVGVTHTIASAGAMDGIAETLTAPVQPWDALICTSQAVRGATVRLLEAEGAWLKRRLGATRIEGPRLPVIPLGVDGESLAPDPAARAQWRAQLGLNPQDVAVLHHGRLSFHAKAHPAAMFLALGRAAAAAPKGARVALILSGWFADDTQRRAFTDQARALAPELVVLHVDGRKPEVRRHIWSAADIFTLLSDNIQETFGLAPIEAQAAGLPVVGTDWDGLRETIQHGITGFRVPTTLAGPMVDLADRHDAGLDSYDSYIAGAAQFTAVDVPAATEAFSALIADAGLRARMGEAGRRAVAERFDWAVVIPQYKALWQELAAIRRASREERAAPLRGEERVPRRADPSVLFADYPTRRLAPETRIALAPVEGGAAAAMARLNALVPVTGMAMRRDLLPSLETIQAMLETLDQGPAPVALLVAELPAARAMRAQRALGWLLKLDLVRLDMPDRAAAPT
jgi:glycosyltransferase involved in cell wall biosynthesis